MHTGLQERSKNLFLEKGNFKITNWMMLDNNIKYKHYPSYRSLNKIITTTKKLLQLLVDILQIVPVNSIS